MTLILFAFCDTVSKDIYSADAANKWDGASDYAKKVLTEYYYAIDQYQNYDFSQISGNYDCTNFVSHAILAGGSILYDTGNSGISSTGWYFKNINNRSSSWSGVANLCNFLTSNTTKGPVGTKKAYSNIYVTGGDPYPYEPGEILQFHNGSIWRHSTIIVGYRGVSGAATLSEAVVTGRTSSTQCNNQVRQSSIYPGESRRVIVLRGYYK